MLYYGSSLFIDDTLSKLYNLVRGYCVSLEGSPKTNAPVLVNYNTNNPHDSYINKNFPVGIIGLTFIFLSALVLSFRASRNINYQ